MPYLTIDPVSSAWAATTNRTSVKVGTAGPVSTTFDAANRPTADSTGAAYGSDADGRLTTRPGQRLEWDAAGRLVRVRPAAGAGLTVAETYDALDRLLVVDAGSVRTRYRYVRLTTSVAAVVDDLTGTVSRSVATDWTGGIGMYLV